MKNPHDGDFKDLAEDHPKLLLRLLGILQTGAKSQISHILRELRLEPLAIDHAYVVESESGKYVVHLEAVTKWNLKQTASMALYQFLLKRQEKLPVVSHVILMAEKYAPKVLPSSLLYEEEDGLRIEAPYKVIRLWEIDSAPAFLPGYEPLLPWVPLLKGGFEEFERATAAIVRLDKCPEHSPAELKSKLASLASLRYDKNAIRAFLEKLEKRMMISREAFKVSWLYQEGLEEGTAQAKLEAIRIAVSTKFPGLDVAREIDQIRSASILDEVFAAILRAEGPDEVLSIISTAVKSQEPAGLQ